MPFDLENTVMAAGMVGARVSAMLMFAPFFGHLAVPIRIKAALAFAITALLYPVWPIAIRPFTGGEWIWCFCGEMLVGLVIGLVMNMVFDAAQLAGQIAGVQVGFSMANIIDPQTQVDTPVLSVLHQLIALLIFLQLDVHLWLVRGVANSFEYLPAGSVVLSGAVVSTLWKGAAAVWLAGIQIAAPVLVATMVTDVVLGFLAKASPQFPALLFGLSAKTVLGFFVLGAAMRYWPALFERYFGSAVLATSRLLHLAR
jgi:flagellar biosynthetic protein FliR